MDTLDEVYIDLVRGKPVIYDTTSELYRDTNRTKDKAWHEIMVDLQEMGYRVEGVKQLQMKWKNFRDRFCRLWKELERNAKSGVGSTTNPPKWRNFNRLLFLKDHMKHGKRWDIPENLLKSSAEATENGFDLYPLPSTASEHGSPISRASPPAQVANDHIYVKRERDKCDKVLESDADASNLEDFTAIPPPNKRRKIRRRRRRMSHADMETQQLNSLLNILKTTQIMLISMQQNAAHIEKTPEESFADFIGVTLKLMPKREKNEKMISLVKVLLE